jgi:hypothetical protein
VGGTVSSYHHTITFSLSGHVVFFLNIACESVMSCNNHRWSSRCSFHTICVMLLMWFRNTAGNCLSESSFHFTEGKEKIRINKLSTNSSLASSCYSYSTDALDMSHDFCLPSVIVAGFPKCGSSFLFKSLSYHPLIIPTKRKELCLGGILSETWPKMISFLPNTTRTYDKLVLSGCLHLGSNVKAMKQLCAGNAKLIYAVRNVADMLWAAYNFWCIPGFDKDCFPGKHTDRSDKRSPKHFHSLLKAGQPMGGGTPLSSTGNCFREELIRALQIFGPDNVMVIKSEDLLVANKKSDVLSDVMSFLGLGDTSPYRMESSDWINNQRSTIYKVNSGSSLQSRGEKKATAADGAGDAGRYEISGFQPMKDESRKFVDTLWKEECNWLRSGFNIDYEACKSHKQ